MDELCQLKVSDATKFGL